LNDDLKGLLFGVENMVAQMPPALFALILQILSFLMCLLMTLLFELRSIYTVPIYVCIFFQAALAAFFSYLLRMDWWWCLIQFVFPILVVVFGFAKIAPFYYLIAFIFFALVYWSSFRTRVPYYPSKPSLLPAILGLLSPDESIKFIDVGSGLGGLLIELSNANGKSHFSGVEIAPLPWMISFVRGKYCKSAVHFFFGNYEKFHLGEYDIVFAYLSPAAMPELWEKAKREMKSGAILLSYEFIIPNVKPDLCINMDSNDPTLYLWRI
jgi:signal transduction histidine kinase